MWYWDPNQGYNGVWVNSDTGETASDAYYQQYIVGAAPAQQAQQPAATSYSGGGGGGSVAGPAQPGMSDLDLYNTAWILEQQKMQLSYQMNQEQMSHDASMLQINLASQERVAAADRKLQESLLNKQITSSEYMQKRDLVQRESEFARQLAFNQEQFRHQQEMDRIEADHNAGLLEIARAGEFRAERELRARLEANPVDWIAYQEYMRQSGDPSLNAMADRFSQPEAAVAGMGGAGEQFNSLSGSPYPESSPAVSNQQIQNTAASLFGGATQGGQQQPLYNPNLQGTGYGGAQINSPNDLSRAHTLQLSDTEMAMLQGLLKAGIQIPGSEGRVAINPEDYFQQTEKSWIPTFGSIGTDQQASTTTKYS